MGAILALCKMTYIQLAWFETAAMLHWPSYATLPSTCWLGGGRWLFPHRMSDRTNKKYGDIVGVWSKKRCCKACVADSAWHDLNDCLLFVCQLSRIRNSSHAGQLNALCSLFVWSSCWSLLILLIISFKQVYTASLEKRNLVRNLCSMHRVNPVSPARVRLASGQMCSFQIYLFDFWMLLPLFLIFF